MCLCGMLAADYETLPTPMRDAVVDFFDENEAWSPRTCSSGARRKAPCISGDPAGEAAQTVVLGRGAL